MSDDVTVQELANWLVWRGLAEEQRGYGHATGEEIAERLLADFTITRTPENVETPI